MYFLSSVYSANFTYSATDQVKYNCQITGDCQPCKAAEMVFYVLIGG